MPDDRLSYAPLKLNEYRYNISKNINFVFNALMQSTILLYGFSSSIDCAETEIYKGKILHAYTDLYTQWNSDTKKLGASLNSLG